jgi:hypothetical protein
MNTIFALTPTLADWQALLADPGKQWKTGYSACTLAYCWMAARGFPPEVAAVFGDRREPVLNGLYPVLGVPEFKVPLPGGARPSQNDIFVLAKSEAGAVVIMVEGKVGESFGPTMAEWLREASPGKKQRLAFLTRTLGLPADVPDLLRYQLLHRAVSALLTAEQYRAVAAVLLVHSFSAKHVGWADYSRFAALFGVAAEPGEVQRLHGSRLPLFGLWVTGDDAFLCS